LFQGRFSFWEKILIFSKMCILVLSSENAMMRLKHLILFFFCLNCFGGWISFISAQNLSDIKQDLTYKDGVRLEYRLNYAGLPYRAVWSYDLQAFVNAKKKSNRHRLYFLGDDRGLIPSDELRYVDVIIPEKLSKSKKEIEVVLSVQQLEGKGAVLRSLVMPGWGLERTTALNRYRWSRTIPVYGLIASSFVFRALSRDAYKSYLSTSENTGYPLSDYKDANLFHQLSLITLGAGVVWWGYDLLDVWRRSGINKKINVPQKVKIIPEPGGIRMSYALP